MNFEAQGRRLPASLTKREKQVLDWVVQGKTNSETGNILGISGRTVAKHIEHIFEKLGIENRVLLAANFSHRLNF